MTIIQQETCWNNITNGKHPGSIMIIVMRPFSLQRHLSCTHRQLRYYSPTVLPYRQHSTQPFYEVVTYVLALTDHACSPWQESLDISIESRQTDNVFVVVFVVFLALCPVLSQRRHLRPHHSTCRLTPVLDTWRKHSHNILLTGINSLLMIYFKQDNVSKLMTKFLKALPAIPSKSKPITIRNVKIQVNRQQEPKLKA